jgi:MFS family permease
LGLVGGSWWELAALCVGYTVGSAASFIQPLWIAAFVDLRTFHTGGAGWLASGELLLVAIGALLVSTFGHRLSGRRLAATAAVAVAVANAIAMVPLIETIAVGRLLSGLGMGALTAAVMMLAAKWQDMQRVFALMQGTGIVTGSLMYFAAPIFVSHHGPMLLFATVGLLSVCAAGLVRTGFSGERLAAPVSRDGGAAALSLAPMLASFGWASVAAGVTAFTSYVMLVGKGLGFSDAITGDLFAVSSLLIMLGPAGAVLLGNRAGIFRPLFCGLLAVAVAPILIVRSSSPPLFLLGMVVFGVAGAFVGPFMLAAIGRLDASGRFVGASPAFLMLGMAVGPAVGGAAAASIRVLALVSGACVGLAILLFAAAATASGQRCGRVLQVIPKGEST